MIISIEAVQRATAAHYGIPYETMRAPSGSGFNTRPLAHPRQVAMALAYRLTRANHTTIGRHFGGRDHTTVIHAVRAVDRRLQTDPALSPAMREITLGLVRC